MKRLRRFAALLAMAWALVPAVAQDIQLHYDLGHALYSGLSDRQTVTSTVEMYKPDKYGSTYFFTDFYYQADGVSGAYWEVSHEVNLRKGSSWAVHGEYNGGLSSDHETWMGNRFQHAVLFGPAMNLHSADFSRTFSLQVLYRYAFKSKHYQAHPYSGFQVTEVWGLDLAHRALTLSGYCDLWYNPDVNGRLILAGQPQFWLNLDALRGLKGTHLSVGSEVEVSNNFVWNDRGEHNRFYVIPTVALKYTF